jgi:nicotinamidase-related amidase
LSLTGDLIMNAHSSSLPGLLVIDVQKGIDDVGYWGGNRNNPEAEGNIKCLLTYWEEMGFPVFVIRHLSNSPKSPFFPGTYGCELKDFVTVREETVLVGKSATNAFINTSLELNLRKKNVKDIFVTGFVTNNSVEATARMAGELGFNTCVVSDATAAFNMTGIDGNIYSSELIHQISLANLDREYASIKTTRQVIDHINAS